MKLTFSLTDDSGKQYTGTAIFSPIGNQPPRATKASKKTDAPHPGREISFEGNPRAFMKRHSGALSGPEKFTLLLAKSSAGDCAKTVDYADIKKAWGKMTGILGKFNPALAIRAKDNGWVDTPKPGVYILCPAWTEIFGK